MGKKEQALTPAQQNIVRSLTAERTQALTMRDDAIAEYLRILKSVLKLKGNWAWGGTTGEIKLVRQEEPPKEPDA